MHNLELLLAGLETLIVFIGRPSIFDLPRGHPTLAMSLLMPRVLKCLTVVVRSVKDHRNEATVEKLSYLRFVSLAISQGDSLGKINPFLFIFEVHQ